MYCRKCGREIPDDSVMCGYCGTPVNPDNPYTYGGTPQNMDEGANGLGIASMILGIVAILLACCALAMGLDRKTIAQQVLRELRAKYEKRG